MPTLTIALNESLFPCTEAYANQHDTSINQIVLSWDGENQVPAVVES